MLCVGQACPNCAELSGLTCLDASVAFGGLLAVCLCGPGLPKGRRIVWTRLMRNCHNAIVACQAHCVAQDCANLHDTLPHNVV